MIRRLESSMMLGGSRNLGATRRGRSRKLTRRPLRPHRKRKTENGKGKKKRDRQRREKHAAPLMKGDAGYGIGLVIIKGKRWFEVTERVDNFVRVTKLKTPQSRRAERPR